MKNTSEIYFTEASPKTSERQCDPFDDQTSDGSSIDYFEILTNALSAGMKNSETQVVISVNSKPYTICTTTNADFFPKLVYGTFGYTSIEPTRLTDTQKQLRDLQRRDYPLHLRSLKERLIKLSSLEENWDGRSAEKPCNVSLSNAHLLLENMLMSIIDHGRIWHNPYISTDYDGNTTIEFRNKTKQLHIYVAKGEIEYIKVWGNNIVHEMYDGDLERDTPDIIPLWDWLFKRR